MNPLSKPWAVRSTAITLIKRALFASLSTLALFSPLAAAGQTAAPSDADVQARASALEVAGAFSNDGFKIRDGHWSGKLTAKESKIIQVNLYAGNQYWFVAAASPEAKRLTVTLYDETGKPVASQPYENNAQAAAGFLPKASGPYYVRVEETEGEPASFCLLYSYK
jgi:hypothetical protein